MNAEFDPTALREHLEHVARIEHALESKRTDQQKRIALDHSKLLHGIKQCRTLMTLIECVPDEDFDYTRIGQRAYTLIPLNGVGYAYTAKMLSQGAIDAIERYVRAVNVESEYTIENYLKEYRVAMANEFGAYATQRIFSKRAHRAILLWRPWMLFTDRSGRQRTKMLLERQVGRLERKLNRAIRKAR